MCFYVNAPIVFEHIFKIVRSHTQRERENDRNYFRVNVLGIGVEFNNNCNCRTGSLVLRKYAIETFSLQAMEVEMKWNS